MLEAIYTPNWLLEKPRYGFLLGLVFSIFGIFSAKIIFGSNPGLMSVAFTSMLLMPILAKLMSITESKEIREEKFSIRQLIKDHEELFMIYTYIFLGIMATYSFFTLVWTKDFTQLMLEPQLKVAGLSGMAYGDISGDAINRLMFGSILINNLKVMIVCFLLSFFFGAGSILFIAWNASVWGSVFGFVAKMSAINSQTNPFLGFASLMVPVFPHMITEAISYFSAAIVGGVVSKAIMKEKWGSERFKHVLTDSLLFLVLGFILVFLAAYLEVFIFPMIG